VKTSLAPGSQVVTDYLESAGLQKDLDKLGFNLVGYGCTTCIGNSGPLPSRSPRRSTRGPRRRRRALGQPQLRGPRLARRAANYLASPPLVVAYALAGTVTIDLTTEPLGTDKDGKPVYPEGHLADQRRKSPTFIEQATSRAKMFPRATPTSSRATRTGRRQGHGRPDLRLGRRLDLCAEPALFRGHEEDAGAGHRHQGRARARLFGDKITTDHISPAGSIKAASPAGKYLTDHQVSAGGLQPVRHAPRQPRSDDARHLRQHPHQEPDAGRRASKAATPSTTPDGERCRSTTRP
jgi:aconitate hydratase